jgi:hypothetical protein
MAHLLQQSSVIDDHAVCQLSPGIPYQPVRLLSFFGIQLI